MSELLDKQVYVQIEILKIIFQGSCKPMRKVCDEEEKDDNRLNIFVVEGGIYEALLEGGGTEL